MNGRNIWGKGGLLYDAYYVLLINAFFPPFINYFNPFYLYKLFMQFKIKMEGPKCKIPQIQANKLANKHIKSKNIKNLNRIYEGPNFDLAIKYAGIMKTIFVTGFYAYELPIIVIYGVCYIILTYFVEKYLLLRRYSKPQLLDSKLSRVMLNFIFSGFLLSFAVNQFFQIF